MAKSALCVYIMTTAMAANISSMLDDVIPWVMSNTNKKHSVQKYFILLTFSEILLFFIFLIIPWRVSLWMKANQVKNMANE